MKLGLVLMFGLSLLPILAASRGRSHTTVFYWGLAGMVLWLTGLALALAETRPSLLVLSHAAGPVSASLLFQGAQRFARRDALRWIPVAGSAGAVLIGSVFYLLGRQPAVALEVAISFPMLIASAWVVNENAWRTHAQVAEKALGSVLVLLAVLMPVDIVTRLYVDADRFLLPAWATLAFAIAFLTLASLAQRAARRALRLTSELQERTASLAVERSTLRALVESSPVGIALTDPPGRIRYLNARGSDILGIDPPSKWHGRYAVEIAEAVDRRLTADGRAKLASIVGNRFSETAILPRADLEFDDGAQVVDLMSQPVRSEDGSCLGRVWICQDVTEDRRVGERLTQAQRMETVGTLAGGVAHDFNNQLTAILGNVDLLLSGLPEADPRRCYVESVEQSALHCAELTRGLLTFAKKRPSSPRAISVEDELLEVVALLRPGLGPGAELTATVAEGTGPILAEADDFRRVLMNLGVNARDAVADHGSIRIEARRLDAPEDEYVELVVADDGPGLDERTRRRIFDPFFTTKEPGKGTGLGLSVVYGIVEAHGASIDVESTPGIGTTFRLRWPAASTSEERAPAPIAPERPSRAGATVLLGEDDALVRDSARGMLERAGYRVIEAVDGPGAVTCFRDHGAEVDLVLLDLALPGCSGLDALREIRRMAPGQAAILISGNPDPYADEVPPGIEFLLKPFRSHELMARIQDVLGRRSATRGDAAPRG